MSTKQIAATKTYRVVLTKSIRVGRASVHPGPNVRLRGDVLKSVVAEDASAVASFEAVAEAAEVKAAG